MLLLIAMLQQIPSLLVKSCFTAPFSFTKRRSARLPGLFRVTGIEVTDAHAAHNKSIHIQA